MYDTIIIGGGISGFTCAMYAGRLGMKTLVLEGNVMGGTITTTNIVENWPGIKKISGEELALQIMEHAKEYKIGIKNELVEKVEKNGNCFSVEGEESAYQSKTLVFATGASHRKLTVKGAHRLENKGVHYCALCDGPLYTGKDVAVIGGSDSAAKEALLLTEYARNVHLIFRKDVLRGEPLNNERVEMNKKIIIHPQTMVTTVEGKTFLEKLTLSDGNGTEKELKVSAAFVAIGIIPNSGLAEELGVRLNKKKEIMIDRRSSTNILGAFACGDVADTRFKQAITGAGEAVTAAYWAYTHVNEGDYICPQGDESP